MSSHREAPAIAKDPAADSTDVYAFVSPDAPDTVTIIANYVPFQDPDGGPNFFEFGAKTVVGTAAPVGDDVLYQIHIDNTGTGIPSITYQFQFTTTILDPNTFLYATGPITYSSSSGYSSTWNRRQTYSITKILTDVTTGDSTSTIISPQGSTALPATWASGARRTTPRFRLPPSGARRTARSSSPANVPTASSWTSAPFSTSVTCGPSRVTS
jgi:hypothetical protein